MYTPYLAISVTLACVVAAPLVGALAYFHAKRRNFILQTRSPHLLSIVCAATVLLTVVWAAEEIRFAVVGRAISPYILGAMSHLLVAWTICPVMFRAEAFYVMFDASMRKKYVKFIRKLMSLFIIGGLTILLAVVPFIIHIYAHPAFYEGRAFGSHLLLGEWRYHLPVFVVFILLQLVQLRQLTHSDTKLADTLGLISELRFVIGAMIVFTITFFTWIICLEFGVNLSRVDETDYLAWTRLNHLVMIFQISLFSHVILRPLIQVWQHTRQTLKTVALYDAQSKWMHPRRTGAKGETRVAGQTDSKSVSLNRNTSGAMNQPNDSGNWASKYSPKVSRHGSPQASINWVAGEGALFAAHSPKFSLQLGTSTDVPMTTVFTGDSREPRLKSLSDILRHPTGLALFSEFAARHLTLESVMFFEAVDAFESHPGWSGLELRPVYDLGCSMYNSFVASGAEFEINVPGDCKRRLKKIFGSTLATAGEMMAKVANSTRNKKRAKAAANAELGTGTATGTAATASANAKAGLGAGSSGRFEAFLSLPAAARRELYRDAQDEVYNLLKVNLFLPFTSSPEFQNLRRAFDKEQQSRKAAAAAAALLAASNVTVDLNSTAPSPDGSTKPQFLKTPSATNLRRAMTTSSPPSPARLTLRRDVSPARVAGGTVSSSPEPEPVLVIGLDSCGPSLSRVSSLGRVSSFGKDRPRMRVNCGDTAGMVSSAPSPTADDDVTATGATPTASNTQPPTPNTVCITLHLAAPDSHEAVSMAAIYHNASQLETAPPSAATSKPTTPRPELVSPASPSAPISSRSSSTVAPHPH